MTRYRPRVRDRPDRAPALGGGILSQVHRYRLTGNRELRVTMARGLYVVAVHDAGLARVQSLDVRPSEIATVRAALAELAGQKKRRPPRARTA